MTALQVKLNAIAKSKGWRDYTDLNKEGGFDHEIDSIIEAYALEFSNQQNKELRDEIDGLMNKYRVGLDEYIKLDCEYNKLQSKLAEKEKMIRDRRKQISELKELPVKFAEWKDKNYLYNNETDTYYPHIQYGFDEPHKTRQELLNSPEFKQYLDESKTH